MSIEDLSIYSLQEIHKLREETLEAIKVIQKNIVGIPDSEVPTKKSIELNNLQKEIKRYDEEIRIRSSKINLEVIEQGKRDPIFVNKKWKQQIYGVLFFITTISCLIVFIINKKNKKQEAGVAKPEILDTVQLSHPNYNIAPAMEMYSNSTDSLGYFTFMVKMATISKNYKNALEWSKMYLQRVKRYCQLNSAMFDYGHALIEHAELLIKMENLTEAEHALQEALLIIFSTTTEYSDDSEKAYLILIGIYKDTNNFEKQAKISESFFRIYNIRKALANDCNLLIEQKNEIYNLYRSANKNELAFEISKQIKAIEDTCDRKH